MEDIDRFIDDRLAGDAPADDDVDYDDEQIDPDLEAGTEPADEDDAAAAAADLIAGKFKTQDDLVKAYKELEKQFHASRQPQPDAAEEDEDEFDDDVEDVVTMPLPIGGQPQNAEQFWAWFNDSPQDAATWAIQNANVVGPKLVNEAVQSWAAVDAVGFTTAVAQAQAAQIAQQINAQWEQRYATLEQQLQPHQQRLEAEMIEASRSAIAAAIPDQADRTATMQLIKDTPMLAQAWASAATPDGYAEVATFAYNQLAYQRVRDQQAQIDQAQQPAQPAQRQRAATRTRQGAAPAPRSGSNEAADIVSGANELARGGMYR